MNEKWIFVIDTEHYAGNFERELTSYITGQVGECGVGDDMAKLYQSEVDEKDHDKFDGWLDHRPDEDDGCCRPCAIYPTPGWFNHGMGEHFRKGREDEALKSHIACVVAENTKHIEERQRIKKLLENGEKYSNWTIAACNREIKRYKDDIDKAVKTKKVSQYPAYLSVAIYFDKKPTKAILDFMKERVDRFQKSVKEFNTSFGYPHFPDPFIVTGFRLVVERTSVKEIEI